MGHKVIQIIIRAGVLEYLTDESTKANWRTNIILETGGHNGIVAYLSYGYMVYDYVSGWNEIVINPNSLSVLSAYISNTISSFTYNLFSIAFVIYEFYNPVNLYSTILYKINSKYIKSSCWYLYRLYLRVIYRKYKVVNYRRLPGFR